MSYLFNGIGDSLSVDAVPPATAAPMTIAAWCKPSDLTIDGFLVSLHKKTDNINWFGLRSIGTVAGDPIWATSAGVTGGTAASTTAQAVNVWQHACAVFTSTSLRAAILNGGGKGTDAVSQNPTGLDRIAVGRFMGAALSEPFKGRIAHVAIWNIALSDAEVASLAAGALPTSIQAANLVGYWPLTANANDTIGTRHLTVSGATLDGDNPTVGGGGVPNGTARVSGGGSVTAQGRKLGAGGSSMSVDGNVTFIGARVGAPVLNAAVRVSGGGFFNVTGSKLRSGSATFTGGGTVRFNGLGSPNVLSGPVTAGHVGGSRKARP